MISVGEMLRAAREAQGRSLAALATDLCIAERYLRALEEDDIQVLPGLFFYYSFVRQYSATLGLKEKEISEALARIAAPAVPVSQEMPAPVSFAPPVASPSPAAALVERIGESAHRMKISGVPAGLSTAALVATLVLGAGIFAWWNRGPQAGPSAALSVAKSINVGQSGANVALQTAALKNPEDANEVVLSISANEETWVSIASHGKVLFSGILQPSESRTLKGDEVATMKIGNAGGLDIQWNGKSIGRIGPRGQVRTVRFTKQDFHVMAPEDSESTSESQVQHDL